MIDNPAPVFYGNLSCISDTSQGQCVLHLYTHIFTFLYTIHHVDRSQDICFRAVSSGSYLAFCFHLILCLKAYTLLSSLLAYPVLLNHTSRRTQVLTIPPLYNICYHKTHLARPPSLSLPSTSACTAFQYLCAFSRIRAQWPPVSNSTSNTAR